MKHFTPALLTAFSVLTLSFSVASKANNIDSDGFVVFKATTTEAPPAISDDATGAKKVAKTESAAKEKDPAVKESVAQQVTEEKPIVKKEEVVKKVENKANKRAARAVRQTRTTRATRATRAQRNKSLRRASFYRVRSGDTLYRISVKSGVSLSRLVRLNKLYGSKKNNIQAGQKLRLR